MTRERLKLESGKGKTGGKTDNTKELLVSEGGQQVNPVALLGQISKECQWLLEVVRQRDGEKEEEKSSSLPRVNLATKMYH